ncbi:hypothetical protein EFA46_007635 [Halarchaeum sp. CBA1220]|uniref:hypothetical protein n=1 Tax=Halarchaeum sp. CBA1220 TaxID=1853682 RepID=UPI000F3A8D59|nr:hypothetical protein [Halarchaeum sp. CBA1220]QLC34080.1 hypothetical protein EFA46_007635 [Halarchaeum sp. CBA1220]
MAYNLDRERLVQVIDGVLSPFFVIATLVLVGIGQFSALGVSMADTLVEANGSQISVSLIVSLVVVVAAYVMNESVDWSEWSEWEAALVSAMVVSNVSVALVPLVRDVVTGSKWIGVLVLILNSAAYYVVAYWDGGR